MSRNQLNLPRYKGRKYVGPSLPTDAQNWPLDKSHSAGSDLGPAHLIRESICRGYRDQPWVWPKVPIFFFSDLHADADALFASLVASGGLKKTGPADPQFKLTASGRRARFIIGGDCFDKGPNNLRLLRCLRLLIDRGARVHILAGNHDIRVKLGIGSVDQHRNLISEHFFLRMGMKAIPLLQEINQEYLSGRKLRKSIPSAAECRARLYPSDKWFTRFPGLAGNVLSDKLVNKEISRVVAKSKTFEKSLEKAGLDIRIAYAAALKWQQLFLRKDGEFYWFYQRMQLALQRGSFLYIHAGMDDRIAALICKQGVKFLNRQFRREIKKELFDFYYGPLVNTIRTKYRDVDMPMTEKGIARLRRKGIHAIVHGHKNQRYGQRIVVRRGMVNFECDSSVDRNTRSKEAIGIHHGAAVTIFEPRGQVLGISSDYPYIKVFDPKLCCS